MRLNVFLTYSISSLKRPIGCKAPLAYTLCGCLHYPWWPPAASSVGTSWGLSGTLSSQILFKMWFYRKVFCYIIVGLVILNLLVVIYQNYFPCLGVKGFFEYFHKKLQVSIFCKKAIYSKGGENLSASSQGQGAPHTVKISRCWILFKEKNSSSERSYFWQ